MGNSPALDGTALDGVICFPLLHLKEWDGDLPM